MSSRFIKAVESSLRHSNKSWRVRRFSDLQEKRLALRTSHLRMSTAGSSTAHSEDSRSPKRVRLSTSSPHIRQEPSQRVQSEEMATTSNFSSPAITLNEVESKFRQLLLDVTEFIKSNPVSSSAGDHGVEVPKDLDQQHLELRFTGGWVRDKLLGIDSHDIDVAINKMTGYQFGLRLKEYLETPGNAQKYGINADQAKKAGSLAKIEANPEKSKHLETVTTKILGLDIDFVNLRKETYTENSRNPIMEFGTPEEDALRRDANINAMFFNIHSSKVEDFTGRGLEDLKAKIMRTPLEPFTTFKDDPLRVLRLIRFASRYGFLIENDVQKAMANGDIKEALLSKITKERVYAELEKMLRGPNPRLAVQYIDQLGLYHTIFANPVQGKDRFVPTTNNWSIVYDTLEEILDDDKRRTLRDDIIETEEDRFLAWMVTAIIPWAEAPLPPPPKKGRHPLPQAATVVREGLKAPNKVTDLITSCILNKDDIVKLKNKKCHDRESLGMAVRKWGHTWRLQLLFSMLNDIFTEPEVKGGSLSEYARLVSDIRNFGLSDAFNIRPLVDGKTLSAALSTKPGPWMTQALDIIMAWQLRNPDIIDPAAAIEEVKASDLLSSINGSTKSQAEPRKQGELTSTLISHFLRKELKPLFAQANTKADITPAGRKTIGELPSRSFGQDGPVLDDEKSKPWKHQSAWAIDLLTWICMKLDMKIVEQEWGYLVPPILTLLEDTDTWIRAKGCDLLRLLLLSTPTLLLQRTGLTPLFEDTLTVSLSYLPTLTPQEESAILLPAAFSALLTLIDVAHPPPPPHSRPSTARLASLTRLLRHSILSPFAHASDHPLAATALLAPMPTILDRLGVDAAPHLKDAVPLLAGVLRDALALAAHPPLVLAAARGLRAAVGNAWPRMPAWRGAVLGGVVLCWVRCVEVLGAPGTREDAELGAVREELKACVGMLRAVMVSQGLGEAFEDEVRVLAEADGQLEKLFEGLG